LESGSRPVRAVAMTQPRPCEVETAGAGRSEMHADPERVALAAGTCERVACELMPGDALFFHCNTLHCSAPNDSLDPRWALICCYNSLSNAAARGGGRARKDPGSRDGAVQDLAVTPWDDSCVLKYGRQQLQAIEASRL
jgi:hypothetical protein